MMNRTKGILAAGSLTGLVLVTILALGFPDTGANSDNDQETAVSEPTPIVIQQPETDSNKNKAIQAWQTYSSDLENTVKTMQQREEAYRAQIEAANQTILQLQDEVNSANAAASVQISAPVSAPAPVNHDDDDGGDEHEEHEHEEHEHEEHEDDDD
jgi:hypothetical protein